VSSIGTLHEKGKKGKKGIWNHFARKKKDTKKKGQQKIVGLSGALRKKGDEIFECDLAHRSVDTEVKEKEPLLSTEKKRGGREFSAPLALRREKAGRKKKKNSG